MNKAVDEALKPFEFLENMPQCSMVTELPAHLRCHYVKTTVECADKKFFINYVIIMYCFFDTSSTLITLLGGLLLTSLCSITILMVSVTTNYFFIPSLKVLSQLLRMNEHLAGVTILAAGNSSADLITSITSIGDSSRVMFAELFGAGVFITGFVSGLIIAIAPFKLQGYNVLRDTCFYLLGVLYIDYAVISYKRVTKTECINILAIYGCYLGSVIIDQMLLKYYVWSLKRKMKVRKHNTDKNLLKLELLLKESEMDVIGRNSRISVNVEATRKQSYNARMPRNYNIFRQFLVTVFPFYEEFKTLSRFNKIFEGIKAPVRFVLILFIPCVDYELDRHGWSKLLNCIQIITFPIIMSLLLGYKVIILGTPLYLFTLYFTVPIFVVVFLTSRTDVPPVYHAAFTLFTCSGCMLVIYALASETTQIMYVIGVISNLSAGFLGCTIAAWGNGMSDVVANIELARQGYQRMAFAATIGGPMFNSLVSMGTTWLIQAVKRKDEQFNEAIGLLGETNVVFLVILLFSTLIWGYSTNFVGRRSVGLFMCLYYIIFFFYALLGELEIIKTFFFDTREDIPKPRKERKNPIE